MFLQLWNEVLRLDVNLSNFTFRKVPGFRSLLKTLLILLSVKYALFAFLKHSVFDLDNIIPGV